MIISEYIKNRQFQYDTETKILYIDLLGENGFDIDTNDMETLMNMFKFINDNKLM